MQSREQRDRQVALNYHFLAQSQSNFPCARPEPKPYPLIIKCHLIRFIGKKSEHTSLKVNFLSIIAYLVTNSGMERATLACVGFPL